MGPQLRRDQLSTYEQAMADYGDVVRLVVGPPGLRRSLYLVTHPDGVEQVLAGDPDGYTKNTPYYEEIAAYLGNGLLTSGGPQWRQQRRTVAPLFSHRRIVTYVDVMANEAGRMADRCSVAAAAGESIDVNAEMIDYALRTVGRILFGADVEDAVPVIRTTFPVLNEHVRRRGISPLRLPRRWPTPAQVRAARAQRALYRVVDDIIARRSGASADLIAPLASLAPRGSRFEARLLPRRSGTKGMPLAPQHGAARSVET
jgi:cytochrome P450